MTKPTQKGTRGGVLKAAPILVYPQSTSQREDFQEAANEVARGKISPFMLQAVEQFIANKRRILKVYTEPSGEKAKTIMVYPDSPEQRIRIVQEAENQGMKLSPFMIHAAEQFNAYRKRK